jgi:hypothetical protein
MTVPGWVQWLVDTNERLQTVDGKIVKVWEFRHQNDEATLSAWAKHFRNHYCRDCDIDELRGRKSRKEFLNELKFPSRTSQLGPATRAGDFGEILISDYLRWILNLWVPGLRWCSKPTRDESTKGCDVVGFYFHDPGNASPRDLLTVFETKTCFSRGSSRYRLQDAVKDSAKDQVRIGESLSYLKQKLRKNGDHAGVQKVDRFQNPVDIPYREQYGAAALFSSQFFDGAAISQTDATRLKKSSKGDQSFPHPNRDQLVLLVIRGRAMMNLVHELYRRAADEA